MRYIIPLLVFVLVCPGATHAQVTTDTFQALVLDEHHGEPLPGVNVVIEGTALGGTTDADGRIAITRVPSGAQTLVFSFVGFETVRQAFIFPLGASAEPIVIRMEEAHEEMEDVLVTATRTSRTIADAPTRVEVIAGEEIDEKISMEPSNITMLLNESPGITVQQTSAVTGGASIRIQGLDGRYTQLLKDGFPLYGGFSGGLSLLQVPPLDLQQVEVIKGPASTLYGGDAIAGLVNLVTKTPSDAPERSLLVNATSAGGYDLGGFFAGRGERFGYTVLASANVQQAYDPDDDAFTNLPETRRLTVAPRLFIYPSNRTTVSLGLTGMLEEREGGDIAVLDDDAAGYTERNESTRLTSQAKLSHRFDDGAGADGLVTLKSSVSIFDRRSDRPDYRFAGKQVATYSEASLLTNLGAHHIVLGVDLRSDAFRQDRETLDYTHTQTGAFVQETWDVSGRFAVEAGLRADYHNLYGFFLLPKASVLFRASESLSARVGGGLGYKAPTIFLESAERRAFRRVFPLGADIPGDLTVRDIAAQTSRGGSIDVNYNTLLWDRLGISVNQALYFTDLDAPLVPLDICYERFDEEPLCFILYDNADGTIHTLASETNAKFTLGDFKLFLGYVNLNAEQDYLTPGYALDPRDLDRLFGVEEVRDALPLTPKHKTYTVLVYEKHGTMRIGLEAYYTSPQTLSDGTRTDGFWITGVMAERRFGRARLFLNFENVLDTKQTNYAPVVSGPRVTPSFAEIWAPMDGFIVNGGAKLSL